MNNLYDVLEICLQELENGADLETVLARYPDLASELRPILKVSVQARTMAVPAPSPEAVRRGRAKLLQHAAQMREGKVAPRKRMIPIFQRLAISFALTAAFLTSGTGLVSASSSALPGENLYPVKLTWENVRLFFTFNNDYRNNLEHTFENERLQEVNDLLVKGRNATVQYAGVYMEVNGITYVSGIHIVVLNTSILPAEPLLNGMAVVVSGHTNAEGFVDVESIKLLPTGSIVPTGEPVEGDTDHSNNNGNDNNGLNENENLNGNVNNNGNENINENSNSSENFNSNESISGNTNNNDTVSGESVNSNNGSNGESSNTNSTGSVNTNSSSDGNNTNTNTNTNTNSDNHGGSNSNSSSDGGSNSNSGSDGGSNSNSGGGSNNGGDGGNSNSNSNDH